MIKNNVFNIALVSLFVLTMTTSCNQSVLLNTSNSVQTEAKRNINYNISGVVQFPENLTHPNPSLNLREGLTYGTKATITDVGLNATVSLIYPANHPTTPNKTIATGLSDTNGNFILNPNFSPAIGDIFILEAGRRLGSVGNFVLPIRTYIKWLGTGWSSMTTPGLYINTKTTALAIIDENNASISPSDTIGTINISGGTSVPSDIGTLTAATILSVAGLVTTVLADNLDPFFSIGYNSTADSFFINQNNNVGKFADVGNCTGTNCDLTDLSGTNLAGQYMAGIELSGKNFSGADLYAVNFSFSNLTNANLSKADLEKANLTGVNLSGANVSNVDFSEANLTNSDLIGSDLTNADLTDAILKGANLTNANLTSAYLGFTDLTGANLTGATLTQATITTADFSGATWTDGIKVCATGSIGLCN